MDIFIVIARIAVLLPFVMRSYRTGSHDFVNIHEHFLTFRKGGFHGNRVTVLLSDCRIDRHARGSFNEKNAPCASVYLCVDTKGQNYMWKLYEPKIGSPILTKISAHDVQEMLNRKKVLLTELCPKQR